jgi:hypothetical protein
MVAYPNNINYLDATTFTSEQENVALPAAEMEGGYTITRPRFTRAARRTFSWQYREMRDADKAALESFWNQVKGSSAMFQWTHPISGEVISCRFQDGMKLKFKRIGFAHINVWDSETITIVEV